MAATGQTGMGFPKEYGGGGDVGASFAAFETLAFGDLSVLVKVGVQFGLFGGAILQLGTERHHEKYLADLITGKLMGCFAMTETGHGSNVQALGTVATYDADAGEFVITTTEPEANKDYIGNAAAARRARRRLRPARGRRARGTACTRSWSRSARTGEPAPGVRIEDDGLKMGLNGVDNGRIWFDQVRVPREALLNRFADVTEDGDLRQRDREPEPPLLHDARHPHPGPGLRRRRRASTPARSRSTIAIRYALRRRQFEATSEDEEELLLDYGQHQRRLFPLLAHTYALHFAQEVVAGQCHQVFSGEVAATRSSRRELESRAAGTKALGTWHATHTIQECREACGGAGYLAENRFTALKADTDVFTTFEGDNTVLLQLVAKGLLTDYSSTFGDLDQLGMVRFVAGPRGRDRGRADERAQARRAGARPAARRRRVGPGGRAARPAVPARDAAVPRGAHAGRRRPPAQARHRRRS